MLLCRLFRHDNFGELFQAVNDFHDSGGIAAVMPQGKSIRHSDLPGSIQDKTLHVYLNAQITDITIPKRGTDVTFMVSLQSPGVAMVVVHVLCN